MYINKNHLIKLGFIFLVIGLNSNFAKGQNFKRVGYFPTYRFNTIDDIELSRLTHMNISFANPDINGDLTTDGVNIDPVVQQAHAVDLEVFIALAGGAAQLSDWEDWITPSSRSFFIHKMINYTLEHNLQGIDVDLEWGNVNDDYSGFVIELKDSLNVYDLKLSAALPGTYRYPEITDEAIAVFDWINLMVYDLTGPWQPNNPGPHSPYSFAENSIDYWLDQGLNKDKMLLGVPFYGYDFTNQNNVSARTFSDIVDMDVANAQVDQVGQIYYNGLLTIEQKTILAVNELSGIMIWEIGQDNFGDYSLLKRIDETIDALITSSIDETNEAIEAVLYPNPTRDNVRLKINNPQDIKISLISNYQGVLKVLHFNDQALVSIELEEFPKGIYFLFVEGTDFVKTFKLVKI